MYKIKLNPVIALRKVPNLSGVTEVSKLKTVFLTKPFEPPELNRISVVGISLENCLVVQS
jgi:hypothetical protein